MNEYTKNHNKPAASQSNLSKRNKKNAIEYSLPIYKTALLLQIY